MKWTKRHFVKGELRIVRKFALFPVHTDDEYMVWLQSYWVVYEYEPLADPFEWEQRYTGSTYSSCTEYLCGREMRIRL